MPGFFFAFSRSYFYFILSLVFVLIFCCCVMFYFFFFFLSLPLAVSLVCCVQLCFGFEFASYQTLRMFVWADADLSYIGKVVGVVVKPFSSLLQLSLSFVLAKQTEVNADTTSAKADIFMLLVPLLRLNGSCQLVRR